MTTRRKGRSAAASKPTRAICYVRISVDRDNETSTETQEERVRAYCTAHGWPIVDVVVEPGRSAYKASRSSRPGFRRVKGLISSGSADVLVVWKLDRVARDTIDTLRLVDELAECGAQLASVTEHFDTSTASGRMTLTVLAALAEMESATKSERVQAWQDKRLADGKPPTGMRPFGYQRGGPDNPNVLTIDRAEAKVIRDAAKAVLDGKPLGTLVRDLEATGVMGSTGKPFTRRGLRQLLISPTTGGCREVSDGVFVQSSQWKPILDRVTWDKVRAVLTDPARRSGPGNRRRWLLSGIARCERCEVPMGIMGNVKGPRYACPKCHLSIEAARCDEIVQRDLLAMLDPKTWKRLRQGQPTAADTGAFEEAMAELTARFVAGDIDAAELGELAEALRAQQEVDSTPPPPLPDVADLRKAWPRFTLEQRRLVISAASQELTIKPWTPGATHFDEGRVVWTPVA